MLLLPYHKRRLIMSQLLSKTRLQPILKILSKLDYSRCTPLQNMIIVNLSWHYQCRETCYLQLFYPSACTPLDHQECLFLHYEFLRQLPVNVRSHLSLRFKNFGSSHNSLNPTLRHNLRPNSDNSLCHMIDSCKIFGST